MKSYFLYGILILGTIFSIHADIGAHLESLKESLRDLETKLISVSKSGLPNKSVIEVQQVADMISQKMIKKVEKLKEKYAHAAIDLEAYSKALQEMDRRYSNYVKMHFNKNDQKKIVALVTKAFEEQQGPIEKIADAMVNELAEVAKSLVTQFRSHELTLDEIKVISKQDALQITNSYKPKMRQFTAEDMQQFTQRFGEKSSTNKELQKFDKLINSYNDLKKYLNSLQKVAYPISEVQINNIISIIKGKLPKNDTKLVYEIMRAIEHTREYKNFMYKFREQAQRIWATVKSLY